MKISESSCSLSIPGSTSMQVFSAKPETNTQKGILVFQEAFGVNGHIKNVVRRLAQEGYLAAAPELFHRTAPAGFEGSYDNFMGVRSHMEALTPENIIKDCEATYAWMQQELQTNQIGCVGFCMGGFVSYLANTALHIKAAVSFYGSQILQKGISLASQQKSPILLFWGGQDKSTPSDAILQLTQALKASDKDFVTAEISKAEHGFNCDDRASYHPIASQLAWHLSLDFFHQHIHE